MTTIWSICMAMITVMSMGRIICTTITMNMEKATRIPTTITTMSTGG